MLKIRKLSLFLLALIENRQVFFSEKGEFIFFETERNTHTGKATKGKVQDIGEVNKVMPLPLPSSDRVRG